MRRLVYTALSILVIIIVVLIAIFSRNIGSKTPDSTSLSGENTTLTELKVSEVTHSIFYAPQYVAMNLRIF